LIVANVLLLQQNKVYRYFLTDAWKFFIGKGLHSEQHLHAITIEIFLPYVSQSGEHMTLYSHHIHILVMQPNHLCKHNKEWLNHNPKG